MKGFTHSNSVDDALMQMHDLSLGNDVQMACVGRAGKHLANMVETWIGDEIARGTDTATILLTAQSTAASLVISAIMNTLPPKAWGKAAELLGGTLVTEFQGSMKAVTDLATEQSA